MISGEWTLDCDDECADADLELVMVRPGGASPHSHQWSGFSATDVMLAGDDLTIDGTITGSGPIGTDGIRIRLKAIANGNATFFFKMDDGNAIATEVGGAMVESNGHGDDDDDD